MGGLQPVQSRKLRSAESRVRQSRLRPHLEREDTARDADGHPPGFLIPGGWVVRAGSLGITQLLSYSATGGAFAGYRYIRHAEQRYLWHTGTAPDRQSARALPPAWRPVARRRPRPESPPLG